MRVQENLNLSSILIDARTNCCSPIGLLEITMIKAQNRNLGYRTDSDVALDPIDVIVVENSSPLQSLSTAEKSPPSHPCYREISVNSLRNASNQ